MVPGTSSFLSFTCSFLPSYIFFNKSYHRKFNLHTSILYAIGEIRIRSETSFRGRKLELAHNERCPTKITKASNRNSISADIESGLDEIQH